MFSSPRSRKKVRHMVTTQSRSCKAAYRLGTSAIALAMVASFMAGPALAQEEPQIFISRDQKTAPVVLPPDLVLRPNVEQSVFLYVKNPSQDSDMKNVTVTLVQVLA